MHLCLCDADADLYCGYIFKAVVLGKRCKIYITLQGIKNTLMGRLFGIGFRLHGNSALNPLLS